MTYAAGALTCAYAIFRFPVESVDAQLIALILGTVFIGPYLQIQLPRTKIHLSITDALVFVALILYGLEVGILLAAFEGVVTSVNMKLKGGNIRPATMALNGAMSLLSTCAAGLTAGYFFTSLKETVTGNNVYSIVLMLGLLAGTQFVANSLFVTIFSAKRTDKPLWKVWYETCLNVLVIYLFNAIVAGVAIKAFVRIDAFMVLVAVVVFAIVYMTYRRYVNDVNQTAAQAEIAERARAEQAEKHIEELKHHINEQDRIGKALRESKERFRHAAFHDALTNLPNRNLYIETIRFMLEKSKSTTEQTFAVLFLDLDRFKTINESLGHSIGDKLILHVGKRLSNLAKPGDLVARFSGDEFAVILNNVRSIEEAVDFAELVSQRISEPFTLMGRQVFTGVSIGIAMSSNSYEDAEDILRDADIAMYYAKEKNKNYEIFDKAMHTRAVTLLQLETDLRYALDRKELCSYYQPILDLDSLNLIGFEALIRWNHPRRGLIPPSEFIPVSEETGLIVPITLWILRDTCSQMVKWQKAAPSNQSLFISVNLSGKHFAQGDLVEQVATIIVETGINPQCLKLELTESAVMENPEQVILMLKQLKEIGVQLSIDDFGTGYSSLSYLHRFPIDTLKVDRSFVGTMENGTENGEIVRTIVGLAKTLGMNVIAEGIETIHQIHQLRILGCEYGQGYLFSRPVPVDRAAELLENKTRWQRIMPDSKIVPPAQKHPNSHLRLAK